MVSATTLAYILLFALGFTIPRVSASAFLHLREHGELQEVTLELVERTLLSELSKDSVRLQAIEHELRPLFVALPKTEQGTLEPAAVRYALHRYFVQKHGWYVKGLEPAGQAWNSSMASSITKSRVPAYVQSLFEGRLHGAGMDLHDLAVFAATLLDFVQNDMVSDVVGLYSAFGHQTTGSVSRTDVDRIVKAYALQVLDGNETITSKKALREMEVAFTEDFPAWGDMKLWIKDVIHTASWKRSRRSLKSEDLTLDIVMEQLQELSDRLGSFQDLECRTIKAGLADLEYRNSGRVLLSDFYRAGLEGEYLFIEHADYLRRLGALDESDLNHPSVIIANYLGGQANCLASTNFHSVCCFDECEGLMGQLEHSIAAPTAAVGQIAELVAGLRSDTVDAPRNLSASLLSRLADIADHHHGVVPLHGRLFAQWMHHAYPLECPYPHAAGTTSPLSPAEWMDENGAEELAASEGARKSFIKDGLAPQERADVVPWLAEEELVVTHHFQRRTPKRTGMVRMVAAFAVVMSLAVPVVKFSAWLASPSPSGKFEHLV